ncbi:hypothetical protein PCASD_13355 [Puccinia coronata f. sp. avenae]|uniref:Uncharacterized protein n=1 Tax=Puccinia coronata f. sp. avenae TaxID=200324 RepID=A0A2N5U4G6_9BASI|nr:hypothetical protein PCASD_13355 [Puccinia coronata f. sp. avenae]
MNLAEKKALLSVHEAASYNAERWDKTHKDHDFGHPQSPTLCGHVVLVSSLSALRSALLIVALPGTCVHQLWEFGVFPAYVFKSVPDFGQATFADDLLAVGHSSDPPSSDIFELDFPASRLGPPVLLPRWLPSTSGDGLSGPILS